ncbi:MAG TPA: hypothetical protein VK442_04360, partial [Xanthobacteraceae bacterium]|nr:hypothetical protein [Xanthobacteraceae bacterium]
NTLILTDASGDYEGVISGTGGLTLTSGTETLSGADTYSGETTINGGTLDFTSAVDSSVATTFNIASAAVLEFGAAVGTATTNPTITFQGGTGELYLSSLSNNFYGIIADFAVGEEIYVPTATSASFVSGSTTTVDVYAGATILGTLTFSGLSAGDTFNVSAGVITLAPVSVLSTSQTLGAESNKSFAVTGSDTSVTFGAGSNNTVTLLGTGDSVTFGVDSDNTVTLQGSEESVTFGGDSDSNKVTLQGSGDSVTFGAGSSSNMVTLQGSGDSVSLSSGSDNTVVIPSGGTPVTIGGTGNSGTISGYATITDYATSTDFLELAGAPVATANTSGDVNGTDSTLTIGGSKVGEDSITNGIITFYTNSGTSLSLNATNTSAVAAAVQYLESNNLGAAGDTVAFTATIDGIAQTYIYEQVGASPNPANDILVDLSGVTVTNLATLISGGHLIPAGVAGSPINLALANPSGAEASAVTVTLTGVPSDWSLNEGTNLGNGTWTVETDDLSALTVTAANDFAGAVVLQITETWTNADGGTGTATIADNVEAYAPGNPIFALPGNDTLTGAGANDLFVFAQPIGNDTIYNFNAVTDKIDLMGFANVTSFSNIQIAEDSTGDAVITIGAGETITLQGVNAASLTAADFVFNQTPVVENDGTMVVSDGAILPLGGTIDNSGTIALNSSGDQTELKIIGDGVTLQGGGQLTLSDSDANNIVDTSPGSTLTNVDNTISGAGQIGIGDSNLTLVNETAGTINANIAGGTLTLDTGNTITNAGLLEATNGGTLDVQDGTIDNTGTGVDGIALGGTSTLLVNTATLDLTGGGDVSLASGSQIIENADSPLLTVNGGSLPTLDLDNVNNIISGAGTIGSGDGLLALTNGGIIDADVSGETLTVNTGNAMTNTGTLEASNGGTLLIDDAVNNSGAGTALIEGGIVDFASTTNLNEITFNKGSGTPAYGELVLGEPTNGQNVTVNGFIGTAPNLTDSDGIDLAGTWTVESETSSGGNTVLALKNGTATVTLTFDDFNGTLNVASDGNGGTLITDPPATQSCSSQVSIGCPGNDNFIFHPSLGADPSGYNAPDDAAELEHLTSAQAQRWSAIVGYGPHEDVIDFVHHGDTLTSADLNPAPWHQALQYGLHLH